MSTKLDVFVIFSNALSCSVVILLSFHTCCFTNIHRLAEGGKKAKDAFHLTLSAQKHVRPRFIINIYTVSPSLNRGLPVCHHHNTYHRSAASLHIQSSGHWEFSDYTAGVKKKKKKEAGIFDITAAICLDGLERGQLCYVIPNLLIARWHKQL